MSGEIDMLQELLDVSRKDIARAVQLAERIERRLDASTQATRMREQGTG